MSRSIVLTALVCTGIAVALVLPFWAWDRWQQHRRRTAAVLRALETERLAALKRRRALNPVPGAEPGRTVGIARYQRPAARLQPAIAPYDERDDEIGGSKRYYDGLGDE